MTAFLLCAVVVLSAFLPREAKDFGLSCPRGVAAFACALFSALALPWSGVSVIHFTGVGSWSWFPSVIAAIIFSPIQRGAPNNLRVKVFLIVSIAASAAAMSRFMSASGVPGQLFSVEGLSMIARLCGPGGLGAPIAVAALLIASGLVVSFIPFAAGCPRDAAFSVLSFSFSGFLAITFIPLNLSGLIWLTPRASAVLAPLLLFAASCVIRLILVKHRANFARNRQAGQKYGNWIKWVKILPLALTAVGCFIFASL
jgi:hypothetical protein